MEFIFIIIILMCRLASASDVNIDTISIFPFGYRDSNGKLTGFIYDINNLIMKEAGLSYSNDLVPYPRTILNLKNGNSDIVTRYSTSELLEVSVPVASIIEFQTIVIGLKDRRFHKLEDLHGKKVGIIRGGNFDDKFDSDRLIEKVEVINYEQMFNMLLLKRIDAVIGSDMGLYTTAKRMKIDLSLLGNPLLLQRKQFILHYSKKSFDSEKVKKIQKAIVKLKEKNEFNKMVKTYR